ncbi:MAG TPA: hypothetical protein VF235_04530 [Actinomycetota bacterium]
MAPDDPTGTGGPSTGWTAPVAVLYGAAYLVVLVLSLLAIWASG